jgi:hypothetical protein
MCKSILYLAAFIYCFPLLTAAQSSSSFSRSYTAGESYRYRLSTNVTHNGKWHSRIVAVCELKVVKDSNGIPADELRWISKKVLTLKDTLDMSAEAARVAPYLISLHPEGKLDLPLITVPGMTGEITDLNTFFVAVAPASGVRHLKRKNDRFTKPEPARGNFANGKDIIAGEDCIQMTLSLLEDAADSVVLQTDFVPPAAPCLHYLLDEMRTPVVKDTLNNFQMVRPTVNGKFNVLFGKEKFNITSTLQKRDGKITRALMSNTLTLKMKLNYDAAYAGCQAEIPFTIQRDLLLELMDL